MYRKHVLAATCIIASIIVLIIAICSRQATTVIDEAELNTLRFVQVVFRHGERTNIKALMLPNDPNINFTYPPYGYGALTNKGKQQAYNIGRYLRQRYNGFLGNDYSSDLIKSITSSDSRTQMSLQLVLAGLFPPEGAQIWTTDLKWQPIDYTTIPTAADKMFSSYFCPRFRRIFREFIVNSSTIHQYYQENKELFDYISLHSGINITTTIQLYGLYTSLPIEEQFGLTIPKWTQRIYPNPLQKHADNTFKHLLGTEMLKRLAVGYLLRQLNDEIYDKINNKFNQKLSLYSGHDFNIAALGATLNLFDYHSIPFSAYILIELHEIDKSYVLKFYYQDYQQSEPKLINLCAHREPFITINEFSKMIEKYLAEDDECEEGPGGLDPSYTFLM